MTNLDKKNGVLNIIIPIPRSTPASPGSNRDKQHATSSLQNASIAVRRIISLEIA